MHFSLAIPVLLLPGARPLLCLRFRAGFGGTMANSGDETIAAGIADPGLHPALQCLTGTPESFLIRRRTIFCQRPWENTARDATPRHMPHLAGRREARCIRWRNRERLAWVGGAGENDD